MNNTRQITEAGLFAGILVIFIVGSFYIPLIGTVLYFLAPLPMIILSIRNTKVNVIVASIVGSLISSLLVSITVGLSMGLLALLIGLPVGLAIKRFDNPLKAIAIGSLGALIALLVTLGIMNFVLGISLDQTLNEMFSISKDMQTEIDTTIKNYSQFLTAEQQAQIQSNLDQQGEVMDNLLQMVKMLAPASLLLMSAIFATVNYMVSLPVLKRLKIAHRPLGSFSTFSYPLHLAYGSAAMLMGAYILGKFQVVDLTTVMFNFIYLFTMIFYIQGLAVGYYFLRRSMSKGVSITLLVALSLFGLLSYIALIGFMDVMIDIRRLQPKKR